MIIDGDSDDGTLNILKKFKNNLNEVYFSLDILKEGDFGSFRSPANARNIGILNSSGDYILLLDADMVLIDKNFVEQIKKGLDASPWVSFKIKPINNRVYDWLYFNVISFILAAGSQGGMDVILVWCCLWFGCR